MVQKVRLKSGREAYRIIIYLDPEEYERIKDRLPPKMSESPTFKKIIIDHLTKRCICLPF